MPGKTQGRRLPCSPARRASMRPQRNAGENGLERKERAMEDIASMRPQRNAGENEMMSALKSEAMAGLQ